METEIKINKSEIKGIEKIEKSIPTIINNNIIPEEIFRKMQILHKEVSEIETPKGAIKKRPDGLDYVELGYMKNIADKYYPGWSWEIINFQLIGDQAFLVHGRLTYFDGIKRVFDAIDAHDIHKSTKDPTKYSSIGNSIKAANTDTLKKAFNTAMNISDDIYKKTGKYLSDEQIEVLENIAKECGPRTVLSLKNKFKANEITFENFEATKQALKDKLKSVQNK